MIKNYKKGFTIVETLIVSVFVASVLIMLYSQVSRLEDSYGTTFKYNTVESVYNTEKIKEFLYSEKYNELMDAIDENSDKRFVDITNCNSEIYVNENESYSDGLYCRALFKQLNVKKVYLISAKTDSVYLYMKKHQAEDNYDEGIIKFIRSTRKLDTGYYVIAQYNDNIYGSVYVDV